MQKMYINFEKSRKIVFGVLVAMVFCFFSITTVVFAADAGTGVGVSYPNGQGSSAIQSGASYNYITYISKLYGFAMKAAVALSILMIIYAGYKYLTSRGDSSAINEAKDILFSTLMGAALLMLVILVGNIAGLNTSVWGIT